MREAKVVSQSQLARASGVPEATISRILKGQGRQGPETTTLLALARALSVELRWLQEGIGPQRMGKQEREAEQEETPPDENRLRAIQPPTPTKLQWVTEREAELLSEYRACAEPQRTRLMTVAKSLPKDDHVGAREKAQ